MNILKNTELNKINFFGITNEEMLDPNKIKVITGIAGSAKSSNIDKIFKEFGEPYHRFTSTNKLKNDSEMRFGCQSFTICGGLFTSKDGVFYIEEKETKIKNVVIDEILQSNIKVLNWCKNNVGKVNIIITTDEKQMLVPMTGEKFLKEFEEFKKLPYILNINLLKSYRPRNEETEQFYYELFNNVDNSENMFRKYKNRFNIINFKELKYNNNDIFITHTNNLEEFLYNEFNISTRRDLNFILKGSIASKKNIKNLEKYPILCQNQINKKINGYLQPWNISTPTRYQGSEVNEKQRLYYLIEPHSYITNREFYTVLTRCYNMESLVLVICKIPKTEELKTFHGKKIKKAGIFEINENFTFKNGETLEEKEQNKNGKKLLLNQAEFNELLTIVKDTTETEYSKEFIKYKNTFITSGKGNKNAEEQNQKAKTKYTIQSLIKKEGQFDYNFINEIYKIFEEHDINNFIYPYSTNYSHDKKKEQEYYIDLFSSYPHLFDSARLPIKGKLYTTEDPNKMNFYIYLGSSEHIPTITKGSIITDELYKFLKEDKSNEFEYLFTTDYTIGCQMGHFLHDKAHKSIETKKELKGLHYGFLQKKYIEGIHGSQYQILLNGKPSKIHQDYEYYIINKAQKYEILMTAIVSFQCYILLSLQKYIYNDFNSGTIIVDAFYFSGFENVEKVKTYMLNNFKYIDFRIKENKKEEIITFQSYEPLKTRKQIKTEQRREQRKRKKEEQKAE